ncbi:MAG: hypothetical protein V4493_01335 [Pseudomonadota bacterium]
MAFVEAGSEGVLNGTTAVDVVAAPAAATRRLISNVHFSNQDTVAHTVIVYKNVSGTLYELGRELLQVNEYWTFDKLTVADATTKKIQAKLLEAMVTTNPSYDAAYADAT